jgi:hypothetical protein
MGIIGLGLTLLRSSTFYLWDVADSRLPNAPSMKIYCLYGHGKETERSYWYMQGGYEQDETRSEGVDDTAFVSPHLVLADGSAT